jgi:hypothetical protein
MRRTVVIVLLVVGLAFAFSLTMTRRLISTWHPEGPPVTVPIE